MFDLKITGGLVVDGTGSPGKVMDIGIVGDRIVAMGDLAESGAEEINAADAWLRRGLSISTPIMTAKPPGIRKWRLRPGTV